LPSELEKHLAGRIAGRAPGARRAVYDEVRAGLQSEVRAAAPFMPVQTVVARRRELENAILAVEREAARSDPSRPVEPAPQDPALLAAVIGAETQAPASEIASAQEPETAAEEGDTVLPAQAPAVAQATEFADTDHSPSGEISGGEPEKTGEPSPPLAADSESDIASDDGIDDEGIDLAPASSRHPVILYLGVLAIVICAVALAAAIIGLDFDRAEESVSPPRSMVRAVQAPPDPATSLIKGAGFQGAAQGALKEGNAFLEQRDFERAIASLDDAIRLDPDAAAAYGLRAFANWNKGNVDAAIRDYGAAIERDPSNVANRLNRAIALNRKGEHQAAIEDLDRVIAAEPANANARNSRCWAHGVLAHLDEALADCNEALKLRPDDADTLDSRGFVYLRLGRLDRAIEDYSAVLKSLPQHAGSLYGRGLARIGRGDRAGGNEDVHAAKAVDPDVVATFARYGIR
jgi:Tfp pilus assembly protein PilF